MHVELESPRKRRDRSRDGATRERRWRLWVVVVCVAAAGIVVRAVVPPIIEWNSPHDDEALMRAADSIMEGRWLGDWGDHRVPHMTMAKVPGYAIFLAAIHPTGLTPPVAAYLLYLGGAVLLTLAGRRTLGDRWAGVLFVALALNPAVFSFNFSRVYRDPLVTGLALLILGLAAHLAVVLFRKDGGWRRVAVIAAETVGLGLTFALLLITRNDIQWVILSIAALAVVIAVERRKGQPRRTWVVAVVVVAAVGGIAQVGPLALRSLNDAHYQVALENDFSEGEFARAVTLWASIEVAEPTPFVLVDAAQREAAYAVSPIARELGEWVDGPERAWVDLACDLQGSSVADCDDYFGYFAWALRDAATEEGVSSPAELQEYFGRLADELEGACASGELTCGREAFSVDLPALAKVSPRAVSATFFSLVHTSLTRPATIDGYQDRPNESTAPLWVATVNGADTVHALQSAGLQTTSITYVSLGLILRALATWVFAPLTILTLVLLFTRGMWTSTVGRLALVCFAGWGANLAGTALFYGVSNRNVTGSNPIYIMASQSYLIAGLVLVAALAATEAVRRVRGSTLRHGAP